MSWLSVSKDCSRFMSVYTRCNSGERSVLIFESAITWAYRLDAGRYSVPREAGNGGIQNPLAKLLMPKIQNKKVTIWMGVTYRIYIDGMYVGAAATQATAREGTKRMLGILERIKQKKLKAL